MPAVMSTVFFLGILVPLATAIALSFDLSNVTLEGNASWSTSPDGCILQLTRNQQDADMEPLLLQDADDYLTDFSAIINPMKKRRIRNNYFRLNYYSNSLIRLLIQIV